MKNFINSMLVFMLVLVGGVSVNAESVKDARREPPTNYQYRWVKQSTSNSTQTSAYSNCASTGSNKNISCNINRTVSNSVSGNVGLCSTSSCMQSAGMTVESTKSYSIGLGTNWTPGSRGGKIQYAIKNKKSTIKYRQQRRVCTNGTRCGSWQNLNNYKNVTVKGNYYVDFKHVSY